MRITILLINRQQHTLPPLIRYMFLLFNFNHQVPQKVHPFSSEQSPRLHWYHVRPQLPCCASSSSMSSPPLLLSVLGLVFHSDVVLLDTPHPASFKNNSSIFPSLSPHPATPPHFHLPSASHGWCILLLCSCTLLSYISSSALPPFPVPRIARWQPLALPNCHRQCSLGFLLFALVLNLICLQPCLLPLNSEPALDYLILKVNFKPFHHLRVNVWDI